MPSLKLSKSHNPLSALKQNKILKIVWILLLRDSLHATINKLKSAEIHFRVIGAQADLMHCDHLQKMFGFSLCFPQVKGGVKYSCLLYSSMQWILRWAPQKEIALIQRDNYLLSL